MSSAGCIRVWEDLGDRSNEVEGDEIIEAFFITKVFVEDNRVTSVDSDLSLSLLQWLTADFL
jgi:hypothetical protein